jgi:predicted Zn-dependent protease
VNSDQSMVGTELAQFLAQIGLLASREKLHVQCETIFRGALALDSDASIRVSHAVTVFYGGQPAEALDLLKQLHRSFPSNAMCKSALAMLLNYAGDPAWRKYADEVVNNSQDESALSLAREILRQNLITGNGSNPLSDSFTQFA